MGPVSIGTVDTITELKKLLDTVSDPKKLSKSLDDLLKVSADTKELLAEKSKVERETDAKLKTLASESENFSKMRAAMEAQEFELSEARKTYDHKLRELKAREDKIKVDLHVIEEDRAILDDKVAKFEEWCIRSQAKYDQEFKLAQALKDEYESKISKLKQAIG